MVSLNGGPKCQKAFDFLVASTVLRLHVQVHAILHRLAVLDSDEQQSTGSGGDQRFRISRNVVITQRTAQDFRPELRKVKGICCVESDVPDQ